MKPRSSIWASVLLTVQGTAGAASSPSSVAVNPNLDVYAKPQRLVTLPDGRGMNIYCQGQGSPTVILEAGAGDSTIDWRQVHASMAKTTLVCAYDRAGMGFSEPGPLPRTASAVVADMEALFKAADLKGPYVLVAHSLGSFYVRLFADKHLEQVVGMVLIDGSKEYQLQRFVAVTPKLAELIAAKPAEAQQPKKVTDCVAAIQGGQLMPNTPQYKLCMGLFPRDPAFSDELFRIQLQRQLSVDTARMAASEVDSMDASSAELVAAQRSYGDMPLVALTKYPGLPEERAGLPDDQAEAKATLWVTMHDELAALSSQGSNRRVANSGHYIHNDQPQLVIDTVNEVVRRARE